MCAAATRQQTAPHGAISHPPDAADSRDSLPRPRSARGRERRIYATAQAVRGGYSPAEAGLFPTAHVAHHVGPPIRNPGTRPMPFGLRLRHARPRRRKGAREAVVKEPHVRQYRHARPFVLASEDAMQVDCRTPDRGRCRIAAQPNALVLPSGAKPLGARRAFSAASGPFPPVIHNPSNKESITQQS